MAKFRFSWTAVLALATAGFALPANEKFELRILHTNDMHSRFEQTSKSSGKCSEWEVTESRCYGGFARIATAVKIEREKAAAENVPVVFVNAGDTYQGTIWYTVYKWKVVAKFLSLLEFDVMSLGNHEFDDGVSGLVPFLENMTIPIVTCNLGLEKEPELELADALKNSTILELAGRKVGFIGYLTPETKYLSNIGNVEIYDEVSSITKEAKALRSQGVDIIIALGHSGYEMDLEIARQVPDVDVVVGGHTNTFLYTGPAPDSEIPVGPYPVIVTQQSGRKVAVVQAYAYTKYLGVLTVNFDSGGELTEATGNPLLLNANVAQNPNILMELEVWRAGVDNITQEEIGRTKVLLDGTSCRFYECNLGNLIADAFVDYSVKRFAGANWTNAPIGVVQGGGIRSSIDVIKSSTEGIITREDVMIAMPFYNSLRIISLQGKYLLQALEWNVARYDPEHVVGRGEFLQASGLHVVYDISKPPWSRVVEAKARCANCAVPKYMPIEDKADYNIVMTSFMAEGGDNFTVFSDYGKVIANFDEMDTDVAMNYIQDMGLIYDDLEERITFKETRDGKGSASIVVLRYSPLMLLILIVCEDYISIR